MKVFLIFMFLLFVGYHPNRSPSQEKPFDQLIQETNQLKESVLELKEKMNP